KKRTLKERPDTFISPARQRKGGEKRRKRCQDPFGYELTHSSAKRGCSMVVWTGWGPVAAVIWIACLVLTQLVVDAAAGQPGYYTENSGTRLVARVTPAPILRCGGRAMTGSPG